MERRRTLSWSRTYGHLSLFFMTIHCFARPTPSLVMHARSAWSSGSKMMFFAAVVTRNVLNKPISVCLAATVVVGCVASRMHLCFGPKRPGIRLYRLVWLLPFYFEPVPNSRSVIQNVIQVARFGFDRSRRLWGN